MDEWKCFKDCPICDGTGELPDNSKCEISKYWAVFQVQRKRTVAVEALVHTLLKLEMKGFQPPIGSMERIWAALIGEPSADGRLLKTSNESNRE